MYTIFDRNRKRTLGPLEGAVLGGAGAISTHIRQLLHIRQKFQSVPGTSRQGCDAETETETRSRETETEDDSLKTESLQTESPETEGPETESPEIESPETESPETESPEPTETETEDGTMPRCRDDVQTRPPSCTELSLGTAPRHPTLHQLGDCLPLKLR